MNRAATKRLKSHHLVVLSRRRVIRRGSGEHVLRAWRVTCLTARKQNIEQTILRPESSNKKQFEPVQRTKSIDPAISAQLRVVGFHRLSTHTNRSSSRSTCSCKHGRNRRKQRERGLIFQQKVDWLTDADSPQVSINVVRAERRVTVPSVTARERQS